MRKILVVIAAAAAALLAGCPENQQQQAEETKDALTEYASKYPVPRSTRDYVKVHPSVVEAWGLVETSYAVILHKWNDADALINSPDPAERERGMQLRGLVGEEIQQVIFTVNDEVESLFHEAIEEQPDNPLNHAAYAFYLKSRKRIGENGKPQETEFEAIEQIDRAIEIWPDEASFYLLKIHIMTSALVCHEWFRSSPYEKQLVAQRIDDLRELFDQAEKYDPDNAFVNYYRAMLEAEYGDSKIIGESEENLALVPFSEIADGIMRQIRKGNRKSDNFFFFPPPVMPYTNVARNMKLNEDSLDPAYVDQWNQFGHWEPVLVDTMITKLTDGWTWERNKDDVVQLMLMLYRLGETQPFDRSFFGMQLKLLQPMHESTEPRSEERLAFGEVMRYLDTQYMELTSLMISRDRVPPGATPGVMTVHQGENTSSRDMFYSDYVQGRHARFLEYANERLGLGLDIESLTDKSE